MADKRIEIHIAATGGDQTAAEIRKVETATQSAEKATQEASRNDADATARAIVNREEQLKTTLKITGEVQKYGRLLAEAGPEFDAVFGPDGAAKMREFGEATADMGKAAEMAAQGFAVGGPIGAAIGALVGVMLPELKDAMDDMVESMDKATQAEGRAKDMQDQLNKVLTIGSENYFNAVEAAQKYKETTEELTESLDKQTAAMRRRNQVADAKEGADAAAAAAAEADAIAGGMPQEDAKAITAKVLADQAKAKIQRDIEAKLLQQKVDAEKLQQANRNLENVQNDPSAKASPERNKLIEDLKKEVVAKERAFATSRDAFEVARDQAPYKIQEVDTRANAQVDQLGRQKAERLRREALREMEEEDRRRREEEMLQNRSAIDRLGEVEEGMESSRDAVSRRRGLNMRARGLESGNKTLQAVGKALADGTDAAELQRLTDMVREAQGQNSEALTRMIMQVINELKIQTQQVEILRGQIKTLRTGK